MGDRIRNAAGEWRETFARSTAYVVRDTAAFWAMDDHNVYTTTYSGAASNFAVLAFDLARVVPVGASNVPRSWGSFACAYFGQPSA